MKQYWDFYVKDMSQKYLEQSGINCLNKCNILLLFRGLQHAIKVISVWIILIILRSSKQLQIKEELCILPLQAKLTPTNSLVDYMDPQR